LLDAAYAHIGHAVPTCLERDFNLPALNVLAQEVAQIARRQKTLAAPTRGQAQPLQQPFAQVA
jgi:uncharacterized protein (UPF0276 family)